MDANPPLTKDEQLRLGKVLFDTASSAIVYAMGRDGLRPVVMNTVKLEVERHSASGRNSQEHHWHNLSGLYGHLAESESVQPPGREVLLAIAEDLVTAGQGRRILLLLLSTAQSLGPEDHSSISNLYQAYMSAWDELYLSHLAFVWEQAEIRYPNPRIDRVDLFSAGSIGLAEAIDRYDFRHNVKLLSYAKRRIELSIKDAKADSRTFYIASRETFARDWKYKKLIEALTAELGRKPTTEEIFNRARQNELKETHDTVKEIVARLTSEKTVELDAPTDSSDGQSTTRADLMADPRPSETPSEALHYALSFLERKKGPLQSEIFYRIHVKEETGQEVADDLKRRGLQPATRAGVNLRYQGSLKLLRENTLFLKLVGEATGIGPNELSDEWPDREM